MPVTGLFGQNRCRQCLGIGCSGLLDLQPQCGTRRCYHRLRLMSIKQLQSWCDTERELPAQGILPFDRYSRTSLDITFFVN